MTTQEEIIEAGLANLERLKAVKKRQFFRRPDVEPDVQSPVLQQEGTPMARPKTNKGYTPPEAMPYISIRTAMEILERSKTAVVKLIEAGHIPSAYKVDEVSAVWIMLRSEVEQFKIERDSHHN